MAFGFINTHEDLTELCATGGLYLIQRNGVTVLQKKRHNNVLSTNANTIF